MKKLLSVLIVATMIFAFALPVLATDISFKVFTDDESPYIYFEMGSSQSGDSRFNDVAGSVIYEFPIAEGDKYAQLTWKIRNQYQVSVTNTDPDDDEAFEVVLAAQPTDDEIANGTANWGDYGQTQITVIDLSKWCENNTTGKIWVKMADADTTNGWGGYIYGDTPVTFYSGTTPAGAVEQPKTSTERAAELLATYSFTADDQYFVVGTDYETPFVYKAGGTIDSDLNRFMDGESYIIYAFDVKASDTTAKLSVSINNQYDVRAASSDPDNIDGYTSVALAEPTEDDISAAKADWGNLRDDAGIAPTIDIDLSQFLTGADGKIYVYVGDADTTNGWGGQISFNTPVIFTSYGSEGPAAPAGTPAETPADTATDAGSAAPSTFDAVGIVALLAVSALATAVIVKKKH